MPDSDAPGLFPTVTSALEVNLEAQVPAVSVEERYSISIEVDSETMALINDAKRYLGKVKVAEVIKVVLSEYVRKRSPKAVKREVKMPTVAKAEKRSRVLGNSRYIPRQVKHAVRARDGERCAYVAGDGRRCMETHSLQFDHLHPHALGGKCSADNPRLLCPAHNQLYAERVFGREYIAGRRAAK